MITDFKKAWDYLCEHKYYHHPKHGGHLSAFPASLYIEVVKVNPETEEIDDDDSKNTDTRVWVESGGYVEDVMGNSDYVLSHDYKLDTGGGSFEEAIVNLACIVKKEYGE